MAKRRGASKRPSGPRSTSRRYEHPLPDAAAVIAELEKRGVPVAFDDLAAGFDITDDGTAKAFRRRLKRMATVGQLLVNRKGEFCLLEKIGGVTGVVLAHRDGFGFLRPDDGSDDIYLSYREMETLLDGDRIVVRVSGGTRGKRAGSLIEILERGKQRIIGRYLREHGVGYVVETGGSPHHFVVADHHRHRAQPDQLVELEILEYPGRRKEAQGKILRILGDPADPAMATDIAIVQFDLPSEWPPAALAEAEAWAEEVRAADKRDRVDLRDMPLVTIDGADARDFDDAVYAEPKGEGWRLVVAIADVSHYVAKDDALDREALHRATSVYFADRVVPMLPESLSNGLCSLKPGVDRLCMVCDMQIDERGKTTGAKFYRAVMHSAARLTYTQVDEAHRGVAETADTRVVKPQLDALYGVFRALLKARRRRGALDLDLPEVRITVDDGHVTEIAPRPRNDAHRLIEECMIAANVQAAKFMDKRKIPAQYRVHEGPEEDRFEELRILLQELDIPVTDQACDDPRHMNKVLQAIHGRPDFAVLAMAVLRSMTQAVYQPARQPHFGLALDHYTHFTSPIRRYPDLLVHRAIGHLLDGGKPAAFGYDVPAMEHLGRVCSERERRAEQASRFVEARYKLAYMLEHVGDVMQGTITGVTHFGLFVTLENVFVEGLIHVTNLRNDYYHVEHGKLCLVGEHEGERFTLGDTLTVRVVRADVEEGKLDLVLVDEPASAPARKQSRQRRRRRQHG